MAHGLCCSAACGIFPGQGLIPRPLHWKAGSQPLRHQGSPIVVFISTPNRKIKLGHRVSGFPEVLVLFFIIYYFYFLLAALGLRCCTWAFSSCGERGLLFIAVCGLLIAVASLVAEHGL